MEVLSLLKKYGNGFTVVEDGKMDPKDRQNIKSAEFVTSDYGVSICLHLSSRIWAALHKRFFLPLQFRHVETEPPRCVEIIVESAL